MIIVTRKTTRGTPPSRKRCEWPKPNSLFLAEDDEHIDTNARFGESGLAEKKATKKAPFIRYQKNERSCLKFSVLDHTKLPTRAVARIVVRFCLSLLPTNGWELLEAIH